MQPPSKEPTIDPTSTYEKVWATLDRLSQQHEKAAEETRKLNEQFRVMSAETDRKLREVGANLDKGAKHRARINSLEQVLKKAENFRKIFPQYADYKLILGVAGMSFEKGIEEKAKELGIGVIKFVGDTAEFHTENIKEY
jgi:hypothetical protein